MASVITPQGVPYYIYITVSMNDCFMCVWSLLIATLRVSQPPESSCSRFRKHHARLYTGVLVAFMYNSSYLRPYWVVLLCACEVNISKLKYFLIVLQDFFGTFIPTRKYMEFGWLFNCSQIYYLINQHILYVCLKTFIHYLTCFLTVGYRLQSFFLVNS